MNSCQYGSQSDGTLLNSLLDKLGTYFPVYTLGDMSKLKSCKVSFTDGLNSTMWRWLVHFPASHGLSTIKELTHQASAPSPPFVALQDALGTYFGSSAGAKASADGPVAASAASFDISDGGESEITDARRR